MQCKLLKRLWLCLHITWHRHIYDHKIYSCAGDLKTRNKTTSQHQNLELKTITTLSVSSASWERCEVCSLSGLLCWLGEGTWVLPVVPPGLPPAIFNWVLKRKENILENQIILMHWFKSELFFTQFAYYFWAKNIKLWMVSCCSVLSSDKWQDSTAYTNIRVLDVSVCF